MIAIALAAGIILCMVLGAVIVLGFETRKPHSESKLADLDALAMAAVESNNLAMARKVLPELEAALKNMGDGPPLASQSAHTALRSFIEHGGHAQSHH